MSICKGCGASIDWIRTAAGRSMPVDPEPVFVIENDGPDRFITDEARLRRPSLFRQNKRQKAAL